MYSTLDGARQRAKELHRLFKNCQVDMPLMKCQRAIAGAGGFRDWFDLQNNIGGRVPLSKGYDFWGRLIEALPIPSRFPVMAYLSDIYAKPKAFAGEEQKWLRYVMPFAMALEGFHRKQTPSLRPGGGKGQRLRQSIVSALLLNGDGLDGYSLWLCPEPLAIKIEGVPAQIIPKHAMKRGFDDALASLVAENIVEFDDTFTRVLAPSDGDDLKRVIAKAKAWNSLLEVDFAYLPHDRKLGAALQRQYDLDRHDGRPKVDFRYLDYRGVRLTSRYDIAGEYSELKGVVDAMDDDLRATVSAIACDSRASACYSIELTPDAFGPGMSYMIRDVFSATCKGHNGLYVNQGNESWTFDPEWPEDEFM